MGLGLHQVLAFMLVCMLQQELQRLQLVLCLRSFPRTGCTSSSNSRVTITPPASSSSSSNAASQAIKTCRSTAGMPRMGTAVKGQQASRYQQMVLVVA